MKNGQSKNHYEVLQVDRKASQAVIRGAYKALLKNAKNHPDLGGSQVEAHLANHITKLPAEDARSRAILDQMKIDEAKHAQMAEDSGAFDLPRPVRRLMKLTAGGMKAIAYKP